MLQLKIVFGLRAIASSRDPLISDEEFSSGMLHWNGMWHDGIDLRYNATRVLLRPGLESGIIAIDPLKNNMDTIKYRDEVFVKKYLKVGKDLQVVFLVIVGTAEWLCSI